jgi:DNA-binding NarL/FixJ family response regulator
MVRVLVAEDRPMFRDALQATLTLTGRFEVVAVVGSGEDAVAGALRRTPDVVVMDLEMPDGGGVAATAEILRQLPATRILVLTSYDEDRLVYAALRAGAHGHVLKSATTEEIVRAVQAVARGDGLFSGSVVERISRHLATGGGQWPFPLSRADPAGTRDLGAGWARVTATPTSPTTSCSASRPSATTSPASWPSWAPAPAPRPWSRPARPDSAATPSNQPAQHDRCSRRQQSRQHVRVSSAW